MPSLRHELKQIKAFESPEQEAFLNLLRTANLLATPFNRLLKEHGLSMAQYNILRILRGQRGGGLSCSQIGERMVTPDPDVTRLINRLHKASLVLRHRSTTDRRVVLIALTETGEQVLARLDEPMREVNTHILGHLERNDLDELNRLLVAAREGEAGDPS